MLIWFVLRYQFDLNIIRFHAIHSTFSSNIQQNHEVTVSEVL